MSSVGGVTNGRFHGRRGEVNRWEMPLNWHFEKISRTSTPSYFSQVRGSRPSVALRFLIESVSE